MIVVDSSAMIAMLFSEPEKDVFYNVLIDSDRCVMSAVNAHETGSVLYSRVGVAGVETFWGLIVDSKIEVQPFDETQVRAAAEAFMRFGKGIHAKARLNICDCAAYALAKTYDAPLLFKGDDFSHTDLASAV